MRELRPRLVWLSVSHLENSDVFLRSYRGFYQAAEQLGVAVAVGGRALAEPIRSVMPYTTYGDTFTHLVAFAHTPPETQAPAPGPPAQALTASNVPCNAPYAGTILPTGPAQ